MLLDLNILNFRLEQNTQIVIPSSSRSTLVTIITITLTYYLVTTGYRDFI